MLEQIIKTPVEIKGQNKWVVEYLENHKWVTKTLIFEDGAWMFYYNKLRELQCEISAAQRRDRRR